MITPKDLINGITRPSPDKSERSGVYRFDRNERTTTFSSEEFRKILSTLTPYDFVAYGELEAFYEKTAAWLNVERENILLTSGSDTGIKAIFETFVEKDDQVLNLLPNYAMFSVYSKMFGASEIKGHYEKNLTLNVAKFIAQINERTKIVVVSNPGHTGTVIDQRDLFRIGEAAARHDSLFVVDEAYHHFYTETMIGYINQLQNLVVARTFSKAFGLASLRIGLLIGCKELIGYLYRVKLVHEITGVAAKIGKYMLGNLHIMQNYVHAVNQGKELLYDRLPKMGFKVLRSESNFVFFEYSEQFDVLSFLFELERQKIYIKGPFTEYPFDRHLRITAGGSAQMEFLCDAIEDVLSNRRLKA